MKTVEHTDAWSLMCWREAPEGDPDASEIAFAASG